MTTIYHSPENYGLEVVGHLYEPNLCYEFHVLGVWKHTESGVIFWGEDSGCSCPLEFENDYFNGPDNTSLHNSIDDLMKAIEHFPCDKEDKDSLIGWIKKALLV